MKKILILIPLFVCVFTLGGCVEPIVLKTSTLTTLPVEPAVRQIPLTADLDVSETRASGNAVGLAAEKERLVREATAVALGQDPPTEEGPDVLVGMNVFTTQTDDNMKVTVTGYPAHYINFRSADEDEAAWLNILAPAYCGGGAAQGPQGGLSGLSPFNLMKKDGENEKKGEKALKLKAPKAPKVSGSKGSYQTYKYALPVGLPGWGAVDAEWGWKTAGGKMLHAINLSSGWSGREGSVGLGYLLGGVNKVQDRIEFAYGSGVGVWVVVDEKRRSGSYGDRYYYNDEYYDRTNVNFLAPFVKFRVKYFEVTYRGLLGTYEDDYTGKEGFGWNNNQLMFGVYFGK